MAPEMTDTVLHMHSYVSENVRYADQKAAFVVTLASAMLAYLDTQKLLPALGIELSLGGLLRLLGPLGLLLSAALAAWVVFPVRKGNAAGRVFWGAIASRGSGAAYAKELAEAGAGQFTADLAVHAHELAVICEWKYARLAWAMGTGSIGLLASILLVLYS